MPPLKESKGPYDSYMQLVYGRMAVLGYDLAEMGERMNCCYQTVSKRFKEPEQMTLGWIRKLNRVLRIPAEEARAALPMV